MGADLIGLVTRSRSNVTHDCFIRNEAQGQFCNHFSTFESEAVCISETSLRKAGLVLSK